jgi:hypothetical protein
LSIVGATGSGKTQCALWHLSKRDFTERPWIVYNFKEDAGIDGIPGKIDLPIDALPTRPGVYVVHPHPSQQAEVERQMWAIWERKNIGVYIDEGYMVGKNSPAFRAIITQGRSRGIPLIVLSQRPVWMDKFVFSESEFFQIFRLNHRDDRKTVQGFADVDLEKKLPDYCSRYYDVGANESWVCKPVPSIEVIHETFRKRLESIRKKV